MAFNRGCFKRVFLFISLFIFLPGCAKQPTPGLAWSIPIPPQMHHVLLESWRAPDARIIQSGSSSKVVITARPVLQPLSQHGPEPDWHDKPAEEWPFQWEVYQSADTLRLRCQGETLFPHCRYILEDLTITVGAGVTVDREKKTLEQAR